MEDPVGVQVLESEAHFDEELPDLTFPEVFTHLLLQELAQVFVFAVLHHDVQLVVRLERIEKSDDVGVL